LGGKGRRDREAKQSTGRKFRKTFTEDGGVIPPKRGPTKKSRGNNHRVRRPNPRAQGVSPLSIITDNSTTTHHRSLTGEERAPPGEGDDATVKKERDFFSVVEEEDFSFYHRRKEDTRLRCKELNATTPTEELRAESMDKREKTQKKEERTSSGQKATTVPP